MKNTIASIFRSIIVTVVLVVLLEAFCHLIGIPPYSCNFTETIISKEKLSSQKPKGELRIFTYGESTMHGAHYAPFSSPARWLEAYLKDFLPDKKIKVVNFARLGQDSTFTYETFLQTLAYKPDIVIFYMGHNELLPGNFVHQIQARKKSFHYKFRKLITRSRIVSATLRLWLKSGLSSRARKFEDKMEYTVIESPPNGEIGPENAAHRNSPIYNENIAYFRAKLMTILDLAAEEHVHVLFFKPVSNLKDFAPTYSMNLQSLSPGTLSQWNELFEQGQKMQASGDAEAAAGFYEKAYAIDPTYAELCFRLGQIYFKVGEIEKAQRFFEEARDQDAIVVRATTDIYQVFEELKKTKGLDLIDMEKIFRPEVPGGIMGEPVIEDNVHPSVKGQSLLGLAAAKEIARMNWIAPREAWRFDRERDFENMAKELGVSPDLQFLADLKLVDYFGSRFDNRLYYAQKALEIYPHNPKALRHLAWTYWLMGDKKKALDTYSALKEIDPAELQTAFRSQPDIQKAFDELFDLKPDIKKNL